MVLGVDAVDERGPICDRLWGPWLFVILESLIAYVFRCDSKITLLASSGRVLGSVPIYCKADSGQNKL